MTPLSVQESLFGKLHIQRTNFIKLMSNSRSPNKLLYFSYSPPLLTLRLGGLCLNLPELNQPSALSFLDISIVYEVYRCIAVSLYRWPTTCLLIDIMFSIDDKRAEK